MKTVLIIKAAEVRPFAEGKLNNTMVEIAEKTLGNDYKVIKTDVNSGYDVTEEQEKFKSADLVIFQYPMYWFSMPSSLKKYMDDVYAYGVFFEGSENYGFSGLMKGKKYMLSLTLNAPESAFNGTDENTFTEKSLDDIIAYMHASQRYVGLEQLPTFAIHDVFNTDMPVQFSRYEQHLLEVVK